MEMPLVEAFTLAVLPSVVLILSRACRRGIPSLLLCLLFCCSRRFENHVDQPLTPLPPDLHRR